MNDSLRRVSVVLFDGFELLDVFGPVELLSTVPDRLAIDFLGPEASPIASSQGACVVATTSYRDAAPPDIVLVPGGRGTRPLAKDEAFLGWLREWAGGAALITSVCTGSGLLGAAGLLDGFRATSNKKAFAWASGQGTDVQWVAKARWVEDGNRWTSSGVAAGMDMTAALMASLFGRAVADEATTYVELEVHEDPSWDPFAEIYGLAPKDH